jgi:hypothetical protein
MRSIETSQTAVVTRYTFNEENDLNDSRRAASRHFRNKKKQELKKT